MARSFIVLFTAQLNQNLGLLFIIDQRFKAFCNDVIKRDFLGDDWGDLNLVLRNQVNGLLKRLA